MFCNSSLVLLFSSMLFQVTIWYVVLVSLLDETLTRNLTSSQSFVSPEPALTLSVKCYRT
jgi:hypothetical protein